MEIGYTIFIIIMILTGAWTGYITNDVAIKMLFREYGIGKLKFGGVIVKTRKKLEKSLSLLVEKEIINHNTLTLNRISNLNKLLNIFIYSS